MHEHVELAVLGAPPGATQPVEVERLAEDECRVLYSPGLVEGIAAGDTIRITDPSLGSFVVLKRGGNVAVKFAGREPIASMLPQLVDELAALGGRLDGSIGKAAVFTVPVAAGFLRIEQVMAAATQRCPGAEWWYGNVYDDAGVPLRWWET